MQRTGTPDRSADPTWHDYELSWGCPDEPVINPAEVDLATVSPSRLDGVNVQELSEDKLVTLYHRAQELMIPALIEKVSRVMVERPELLDRSGIGRVKPYADLSLLSLPREGGDSALNWINRGRESDPQARAANAAAWDMLEIRVRSYAEPFESWVPFLAGVLERVWQGQHGVRTGDDASGGHGPRGHGAPSRQP